MAAAAKWRSFNEAFFKPPFTSYQKAADDIARSGGRVTRVVLDFELKRSPNRQFARTAGMSPEEQARRKQEIAEEHGLKVIDGRVVIPDLRLEYETPITSNLGSIWRLRLAVIGAAVCPLRPVLDSACMPRQPIKSGCERR